MNPAALLSLISSLYEQLAAAQDELGRLRAAAAQAAPVPSEQGFVPCDPADGPSS